MADAYRQMDERGTMIVGRALREFGELQAQRAPFAGQWEEATQIVLPTSRNTFFYGSFNWQGQKKTDKQVDMTAGLALHRFCAIADSLITPRNMFWHGLEADGPDADYVMKDRNTRLWFEQVTKTLFRHRYAQVGNFVGQNYNNWQSLGCFGNATMFVDKFDSRMQPGTRGLRYKSVPLGETFFGENHQGVVDRIHRYFRLTPYQCVQKFGEDWTPPKLMEAYKKDSQAVYDFLHVVRPRDADDYDPDRIDERGKPFESYYISMTGQCMVAPEGGYRKFPYAPSRYDQTPGEVYGRGWVQIALPAIKTLNAQKVVFLKQGHRAADPRAAVARRRRAELFSLRPGAMNPGGMSPDGKPLIGVLPTGKIDIAKEMMEVEAKLIRDTSRHLADRHPRRQSEHEGHPGHPACQRAGHADRADPWPPACGICPDDGRARGRPAERTAAAAAAAAPPARGMERRISRDRYLASCPRCAFRPRRRLLPDPRSVQGSGADHARPEPARQFRYRHGRTRDRLRPARPDALDGNRREEGRHPQGPRTGAAAPAADRGRARSGRADERADSKAGQGRPAGQPAGSAGMMNGAQYSQEAVALRSRPAQQLRDDWQCRLLVECRGKTAAVALVMLANLYFEAMEVLLRIAFPNFVQIRPPLYTGHATIKRTGQVVCDYMDRDYNEYRNVIVYDSEDDLIKEFRDIADRLKFSDDDREAMFAMIKKWVSRDERIGPSVEHKHEADA